MARPDARPALLDTAERLFAQEGIAVVSDRRIAEEAGNTNHSAVRYYFGGRDGLLRALLERHLAGLESLREARFAASDSLLGDLEALVRPPMEVCAALPQPTWRSRFLDQARHDPTAVDLLRASGDQAPVAARVFASIMARLGDLEPEVVTARMSMTTYLVSSACAEIERRVEASGELTEWSRGADVLCDALAGLLQAPVSPPAS